MTQMNKVKFELSRLDLEGERWEMVRESILRSLSGDADVVEVMLVVWNMDGFLGVDR